jgi:hypothetical protein
MKPTFKRAVDELTRRANNDKMLLSYRVDALYSGLVALRFFAESAKEHAAIADLEDAARELDLARSKEIAA